MDTRESQRDAHLRSPDFFDVEKYPTLTYRSRQIIPKGDGRLTVVGDLTIRDVTREVILEGELTGQAIDPWGNKRVGFSGEARINRRDFGLTWNVALEAGGFLVGDEIRIYVDAQLVQQA